MYTVFLADDEVVVREGIRTSFPWDGSDFVLAGEAPDGEVALSIMQEIKPDILITDIRMPFMDGLALSRKVASSMPWVHIVILSGFDDFTYAREAISLGVCEYLLKPVSSQELETALKRIALRIDEERRQRADLQLIRRQLDQSNALRKERLLQEILCGLKDPGDRAGLFMRARDLGANIVARHYRVMLISPGRGQEEDLLPLRAQVQRLADGSEGGAHLCLDREKLAVLLQDSTKEELEERAFSFAQAVKHETEVHLGASVHVAIGVPVSSVFEVPDSRASAAMVLRAMDEQLGSGVTRIMDSSDLCLDMGEVLSRTESATLYERLRYAPLSEVGPVLGAFFSSGGETAPQSVMMLNYLYVESLLAAARIVRESGGDPAETVLAAAGDPGGVTWFSSREAMEQSAETVLRRALAFRDRQSLSRYAGLIRDACAFIERNFQNPDLCLGDAARAVHLSVNHFCTVFAQETGSTFIGHLTRLRMKRARELLRTTELRSSEIAGLVGYGDPHYFSYLFKKHAGMSPREYRNAGGTDEAENIGSFP